MKAITLKNRSSSRFLSGLDLSRVQGIRDKQTTPFMLLRNSAIKKNLKQLRRALPDVEIYYAVKANNHPAIIETLKNQACKFDVSSIRELKQVLESGVEVSDTIHTNPIKSLLEIEATLDLGVKIFVVDNIDELQKFRPFGERVKILLRFRTGSGKAVVDLSYKFGAEPEDILKMLDYLVEYKIPLAGFCFHVGSQCTDPEKYVTSIGTAAELIAGASDRGLNTEILDIGGGFPIEYTIRVTGIDEIGSAVTSALKKKIDPGIRIICEPGRFICGDAATLFCSVVGKTIRDGVRWYYIDDGLYGSFSGRLFDHCSYHILTNRNSKWEKAVLAGPTCDSFDVVYKECLLPPLEIGDVLIFPAMGAYCSVSATEFNGLRRAETVVVDW